MRMPVFPLSPGVHARKPSPADVGEEWLWWDPKAKVLRSVELDEVPTARAQRVRIQHLDPEMGGKREWAPTGRCLVPMRLRAEYEATQSLWAALHAHRPMISDVDLVSDILREVLLDDSAAIAGNSAGGILEIADLSALAERAGAASEELIGHPDTFQERGRLFAPWPVTLRVVQHLCERHPRQVTDYIRAEEKRWIALHQGWESDRWGRRYTDGRTLDQVNDDAKTEALEYTARNRRLVAAWCNINDPSLGEEYLSLRDQYDQLVSAVLPTLDQLRMIRSKKAAEMVARLESLLGAEARKPST